MRHVFIGHEIMVNTFQMSDDFMFSGYTKAWSHLRIDEPARHYRGT